MSTQARSTAALVALAFTLITANRGDATIFTVGPSGEFTTIASAIAAAHKYPGEHEIRLQTGTYVENVVLTMRNESVRISGGWDETFEIPGVKELSTIDGNQVGSVMVADVQGGYLVLERLRLIHGRADRLGGGLLATLDRTQFMLTDSAIEENSVEPADGGLAYGGGIYAQVWNAVMLLTRSRFARNDVRAYAARGGGAFVQAAGNPTVLITGCSFVANSASTTSSAGQVAGGGVFVYSSGMGNVVQILGNRFLSNWLNGYEGVAMSLSTSYGGTIEARRNSFRDDADRTPDRWQVSLLAENSATVSFSDSEIVGTPTRALRADAYSNGTVQLTNLTIADNRGGGVDLNRWEPATMALSNSILFGNAWNFHLHGAPALLRNFVGDPHFVSPPSRYDLQPSSAARDAGAANPPGGLGLLDLRGRPRVVGSAVDIGAYELQ